MIQRYLILGLVCYTAISSAAQSTANSTISYPTMGGRMVESSRAVLEATKRRDADALKRLLADDFTQVGSEGRLHDKMEIIGDAREGRLKEYAIYDVKVVLVDENASIVTYSSIITEPEGDEGLAPRYQTISDLWTKQGDQWRLKFQQCTPRRPID